MPSISICSEGAHAQVRVMPKCWFVLLRFWLRVDGVLVRLWETRVCGRFDGSHLDVRRELRRSEGTFAELRKSGAPAEGVYTLHLIWQIMMQH